MAGRAACVSITRSAVPLVLLPYRKGAGRGHSAAFSSLRGGGRPQPVPSVTRTSASHGTR